MFVTLAFLTGNLCVQLFTHLSLSTWLLSFLIVGGLSTIYFYVHKKLSLFFNNLIKFFIIMTIGFCWTTGWALHQLQKRFPREFSNYTFRATGKLIDLPIIYGEHCQLAFSLNTLQIMSPPKHPYFLPRPTAPPLWHFPLKVKLMWYHHDCPSIMTGKWQLITKLKPFHTDSNPGSFDSEQWAFTHGFNAMGTLLQATPPSALAQKKSSAVILTLRANLAKTIHDLLATTSVFGLVQAIVIGERSEVSPTQWQAFKDTGTAHLLAISGLHIGLIASVWYGLGQWLWRRFEILCLYYPAALAGQIFGLAAATFYTLLAGFSLPTQRSLGMIFILMLSRWRRRHVAPWHAWAMAILAILVFEPTATLDVSFYLSAIAVAWLIYLTQLRQHFFETDLNQDLSTPKKIRQKWLQSSMWLQIRLSMSTIPLTFLWFGQGALIGSLANLVAIPLVSILLVPIAFSATLCSFFSVFIANSLFQLAAYLSKLLCNILYFFQHLPLATTHYRVTFFNCFLAVIAMIVLWLPKGWPGRWLAIIFCLPLLTPTFSSPNIGAFRLTLLEVGQGLAVLVQTHHHVLLYDTGPRFTPISTAADRMIIPYLETQHLPHIDSLIISHSDADHSGGAVPLLQHFKIKNFFTSSDQFLSNYHPQLCLNGLKWQWEKVSFEFLSPELYSINLRNNSSCVLKINNGFHSVLLTGDIEKTMEENLVYKFKNTLTLKAEVLQAPHHGSKTSSSLSFILAVHPQHVLFATGFLNRFYFPNTQIVQRYEALNIKTWNTAVDGAITIEAPFNSQALKINTNRLHTQHYWQ